MEQITKDDVVKWLNTTYKESQIWQDIDNAIPSYLPKDYAKEFENSTNPKQEAYKAYGKGEAESEVRLDIEKETIQHFFPEYTMSDVVDFNRTQEFYMKYKVLTGEDVWETIGEIFECLS